MTDTLVDALTPLCAYYATQVATLSSAQQAAIRMQVIAEASDTGERVGVRAEGATLAVGVELSSADVVFRGHAKTMCAFLAQSGREFIVGPILRGRLPALRMIRGILRMEFNEGDEMTICFGGATIPDALIRLSHAEAIGLFNGKLRPEVEVMMGRVRIERGLAFLLSLERIL
jgi:hypothetical protein